MQVQELDRVCFEINDNFCAQEIGGALPQLDSSDEERDVLSNMRSLMRASGAAKSKPARNKPATTGQRGLWGVFSFSDVL